MSFRRFPSEYVSRQLHGLTVLSTLPNNNNNITIATHSGSFHSDEALACSLLRHTSIGKEGCIIRTRDLKVIEQCSVAVDVGAVYDPSKHRYDHHQSSFQQTMTITSSSNNNNNNNNIIKSFHTRLSSAGLIYLHFGREIINNFVEAALKDATHGATLRKILGWPAGQSSLSPEELDIIYTKLYIYFIEEIDGVDNGVECFGVEEGEGKLKRNYQVTTTLSSRIGAMQSWWNEDDNNDNNNNKEEKENANFIQAVELAGLEFFERLFSFLFSWLPARGIVLQSFQQRRERGGDDDGRVVVFEQFCPWKDHLFDIEDEEKKKSTTNNNNNNKPYVPILYVIYSDGKGWRVQAVPKESGSFESRKALPFKGLRDDELSAASGIDGGVFVHVSGFIGGMKTLEGALALAKKAVEA